MSSQSGTNTLQGSHVSVLVSLLSELSRQNNAQSNVLVTMISEIQKFRWVQSSVDLRYVQ